MRRPHPDAGTGQRDRIREGNHHENRTPVGLHSAVQMAGTFNGFAVRRLKVLRTPVCRTMTQSHRGRAGRRLCPAGRCGTGEDDWVADLTDGDDVTVNRDNGKLTVTMVNKARTATTGTVRRTTNVWQHRDYRHGVDHRMTTLADGVVVDPVGDRHGCGAG